MYVFNPKPFRVGRLFQSYVNVSRSEVVIQSFALIASYTRAFDWRVTLFCRLGAIGLYIYRFLLVLSVY